MHYIVSSSYCSCDNVQVCSTCKNAIMKALITGFISIANNLFCFRNFDSVRKM